MVADQNSFKPRINANEREFAKQIKAKNHNTVGFNRKGAESTERGKTRKKEPANERELNPRQK